MKLINGKIKVTADGYLVNCVYAEPLTMPSTNLPLIIASGGTGQAGTDINKMYTEGLVKVLQSGFKPPFDFIMCAPQATSYGIDPVWLPHILSDVLTKYKIDKTRIYLTGFSASGWFVYGSQTNVNIDFGKNFAAILPLSAATQDIIKANVQWYKTTLTPVMAITGDSGSVEPSYREYNANLIASINAQVPGLAKLYVRPGVGHGNWTDVYSGLWKDENGKTAWDWLYSKTRGVAPAPKTVTKEIIIYDDLSQLPSTSNKPYIQLTIYSDKSYETKTL